MSTACRHGTSRSTPRSVLSRANGVGSRRGGRIPERSQPLSPSGERPIRAAEVVGALSLATDLGTGQPLEHALRTAVLAVRLGELAGASAQELADTYYVALLHASGCTSNGHEAAQVYDDDIAHRAAFFLIDTDQPRGGACVLPGQHRGRAAPRRSATRSIEEAIANAGPRAREGFATMCEVAQRFAGWLDLGSRHPGSARVRLRALGRTWVPERQRRRDPVADASPARGEGHLPLPLRRRPRRGTSRDRASNGCRVRASARRARRAELRRPPRRAGRDADVGAGARDRAVPAGSDRGRAGRRRLHGHRRAHRSQVAVASRALDGCGRARRGRRLAPGPAGGFRDARAPRRARARPRSRRRVERDLGEARAARVRRVGAGAAPSSLHGARLRPVAGARSDRDPGRLTPRAARRLRLPPRHARAGTRSGGPHPRRRRLLRRHARGAAVQAGSRCAGGRGRAAAGGRRGTARPGSGRRGARRRGPPRAAATARAAGRADRARAGGAARARARRVQPGDRRRISASRPRPSGTTSSTSTRRPASAAGPRRRSGRSSTTSFAPA